MSARVARVPASVVCRTTALSFGALILACAACADFAAAQNLLPRDMQGPFRSIMGPHHGILINDTHVRRASYAEEAGACDEHPCCDDAGDCPDCAKNKCAGERCGTEKCTGEKCSGKSCADEGCAGENCCRAGKCAARHGEAAECPHDKECPALCGECPEKKAHGTAKCGACRAAKCCDDEESAVEKRPASTQADETARAILEIMESLGSSVIEGTVLEPSQQSGWNAPVLVDDRGERLWISGDLPNADEAPEELPAPMADDGDIRDALIKYIRALESQQASEAASVYSAEPADESHADAVWVHDSPVEPDASHEATIHALRETSAALDAAAVALETLDLYERADQIRGMAHELRHDARRLKQGRVVHARRRVTIEAAPSDIAPPQDDDSAALRQLHRMRESMRRAKPAF